MAGQLIRDFASCVAAWSLDDEWLSTALVQLPRRESKESLPVFWGRRESGDPILCLGQAWKNLSPNSQWAQARLTVHHLLLGHLEAYNMGPEQHWAVFWQAFHYLPDFLQSQWPEWQAFLIEIGELPIHPGLEELEKLVKKYGITQQFPHLSEEVNKRQSFWAMPFGKKAQPPGKEMLRYQVEASLQALEVAPGWSDWFSLPSNGERIKLSWTNILRNHLRRHHRLQLNFTHKRISKRYGTAPGIKLRKEAFIGVVLDTSASMSTQNMLLFYRELRHIRQLGHRLLLVEADSQIRRVTFFKPGLQEISFPGRGNTSYDPALKYLQEKRVDLILYLTDGLGPEPMTPAVNLLWIVHLPPEKKGLIEEKMKNWSGRKIFIH